MPEPGEYVRYLQDNYTCGACLAPKGKPCLTYTQNVMMPTQPHADRHSQHEKAHMERMLSGDRERGSVINVEGLTLATRCGHSYVTCHTDRCFKDPDKAGTPVWLNDVLTEAHSRLQDHLIAAMIDHDEDVGDTPLWLSRWDFLKKQLIARWTAKP